MDSAPVRASAHWLALREPADAAARSPELVDQLVSLLPSGGGTRVHDLGCGTGSMARWLAPRLPGPQHWVLHDRDEELLAEAGRRAPALSADGGQVTAETRKGDFTRLPPEELADADLVTASALLDMLTAAQVDRLVALCARPGCPVLITLSVVGRVALDPADPLDDRVRLAFNTDQRRTTAAGRLLGPDAASAAAARFRLLGREVAVRPSPWRLGPDEAALTAAWFDGWWSAACEVRPELADAAGYAERRRAEAAAGSLRVTVHHEDLLVLPVR
ncbi:SAM-dependent methyltransferase [Nocardioides gansuensis]|uniref:SAM-dependent methyltransferase n=1 Tax=Nocardioides gansuensis TaxID=2138300 RepID=A0A2T8FCW1_9ACTN|nr:class I SAM-dependent methyltransferase [Nocardioides gansuensis]PVG83539.1 SAM-dependent methyltransferase [Nocardioides gansuensis]